MTLQAECPRCPTAVVEEDGAWVCPMHGSIAPLWRPVTAQYDALAEHFEVANGMPSWAPWPMPSGWALADFGAVRSGDPDAAAHASATFVSCAGMTDSDGVVSLTVVTEEPGTGLGARVSGVVHEDPGAQMLNRPVQARVDAGGVSVPLWLLPAPGVGSSGEIDPFDCAVLVGEARGRWLWLVVSPASAVLGLDAWSDLDDLGRRGPELVDLEFVHRRGDW